jgi:hypothetical protein
VRRLFKCVSNYKGDRLPLMSNSVVLKDVQPLADVRVDGSLVLSVWQARSIQV